MNIGIINGDKSTFPNLALMKISAYHKGRGDNVELANIFGKYDKCYCSRVFSFSTENNDLIDYFLPDCGGTGFSLTKKLPDEIEQCKKLDYSLYPNCNFSIQLFSRGCVNKCSFCVVPKKEGSIYPIEPMELNPRGEYIEVYDNNFFQNPEYLNAIRYLTKVGQPVKMNGIDIRTITEENCHYLNQLKIKDSIYFAWDFIQDEKKVIDGILKIKQKIKLYKLKCYVLCGFNSTINEDLYRIYKLIELGIEPYAMAYLGKENKFRANFLMKDLQRWCNNKYLIKSCKFENYKPRVGNFTWGEFIKEYGNTPTNKLNIN